MPNKVPACCGIGVDYPIMLKMTKPPKMDVAQLIPETSKASRTQSLFFGLCEAKAMRPPNARPRLRHRLVDGNQLA